MSGTREPLPTHVRDTPPLPSGYDDALTAGLEGLGLSLDPAARAAIDGHLRLLLAWTASVNLTAIRDPVVAATAHVLDSLSAVPLLRRHGVDRFVDLGSGGGLPGIPIAAALPATEARLVESVGKKARFLEVAADAIGLTGRIAVEPVRAEALAADPDHRSAWPAVTVRAVAALAELVELAFPLLRPGGMLVAWKRGELGEELAAGGRAVAALGGGTLDHAPVDIPGLDGHVLVVATRTGDVPDGFPREPAHRRRGPW